MNEYIIVGIYQIDCGTAGIKSEECLKQLCGSDLERANQILAELTAEEPERNYRIKVVEPKYQWWHQGYLD